MPIFNKKKGPKTVTNNRFVQPLTKLIWQKKKKKERLLVSEMGEMTSTGCSDI